MSVPSILVSQFVLSLVALALVARWYVLPALKKLPVERALPPLILPHLIRPVSLWLLVPTQLGEPTLPRAFATGTAYGDLVAAGLALVAVLLLRARSPFGVGAAWLFNLVGLLDALRNCLVGLRTGAPLHMGTMVLVPAYGVPLLLVSHALVFVVLYDHHRSRRQRAAASRGDPRGQP